MSSVESENSLCLEIFLHALETVFPTVAGTLVPAKRCVRVPVGIVEMDLTRPDLPGHGPYRFHVGALNMRAEAVDRVVGNLDRVLHRIVGNDRQHRAENLLLRNLHVATDGRENSWPRIEADFQVIGPSWPADDELGTFLQSGADHRLDALELGPVGDRTMGRTFRKRIADHQF